MNPVALTVVGGGEIAIDPVEVRAVEDVVGSVVTMRDGTQHFVVHGANMILDLLKEGIN